MNISDLYRISTPVSPSEGTQRSEPTPGKEEFNNVLESELRLSKHAETRIRSREIQWDEQLQNRIHRGIESAREKGSRETLILAGDVAVIANVNSKTVITAMDKGQLKEHIFTNIDSAVLV